jgi:hypothetical protein
MAGIDHALEGIPRYAANKKKEGRWGNKHAFSGTRRSFLFLFRFKKKFFFLTTCPLFSAISHSPCALLV